VALVMIALAAGLVPTASAAVGRELSLRFTAGQLMGLRAGQEALPSNGLGGFYAQVYRNATGRNLLRERGLEGLPRPLPTGFALDHSVRWEGHPTLTIKLPEEKPSDSGELELHADQVQPHRTYLLRFAHRGERLDGAFPPILHIRQLDQAGEYATPQLNVDLLNGSYDWKEEVIAVPAVEKAAQFVLMLHHPRGMGQFWIGEITLQEVKRQPTLPVPGMWEGAAQPHFAGVIPGTEITLEARARPAGNVITIQATLSAPSAWLRSHPTGVVLSFRLPLTATGWRWGDYLRREREIERGKSYSHYQVIGRRQFREVSYFPMAAVAGPEHGIALMLPLKPTLLSRLRYDAEGYLCAELDLGLADRGKGEVESVFFSFDMVRFDPRWGWRSALAAYYARYPELFASGAKEGGWWSGPSERVSNLQDFGLQYAEQHFARADRAKAEDEMGLYTCSYSEPWMWRIFVSPEDRLSLAKPLSFYLPGIERDANLAESVMDDHDYWTAPRRESVRAFLNSVIFGPDGKYQENAVRSYESTVMEMNTSCLPGIRSRRWGDMNRGLLSYRYETLEDAKRCAAGGARLDGVYFDSVGDWSDISAEDHRAEHFRFASYPLTFSYATGRPVISGLAAMAEYMEFIRERNYITMANSDHGYAGYAAPFLDMIGAGENIGEEAASDEALSHDREIAFRKSVSFGNAGMLSASPEEAEARFRLLLFYHAYPGIFSSDAQSLEKVRPLYQRYIPLMREMGAAGWEPVPWATLADPELWVERYGPGPAGRAYFAIRNPGERPRSSVLTVEPSGFARPVTSRIAVSDAVSGRAITYQRSASRLLVPVETAAGDTVVVRVEWPG
jgi:hypothetical protein